MRPFRAILAMENVPTGEAPIDRVFDGGSISWRPLPLTLKAMLEDPEFGGHSGSFVVGRIDTITREGDLVVAVGEVDDEGDGDDADRRREVVRLIDNRSLRGVSVDPGRVDVEWECLEMDDDGMWCEVEVMHFVDYQIAAATVCAIPGLEGTLIEFTDTTDAGTVAGQENATAEADAAQQDAVAASAATSLVNPPEAWFADPELDGPTPLTITDDGRVFGHIAEWGSCHTGFPGRCVEPFRSATGYAHFRVGEVVTAEGTHVAVGTLIAGGGHPDADQVAPRDWRAAQAHYLDNIDRGGAFVAAGEDEHGVWVAGALRPGVTPEQVACMRATAPSGDWRRIGGSMELVAVCHVNSPGFPVRRVSLAAGAGLEQEGVDGLEPEAAILPSTIAPGRCRSCGDGVTAGAGRRRTRTSMRRTQSGSADAVMARMARMEADLALVLEHVEPAIRERLKARLSGTAVA